APTVELYDTVAEKLVKESGLPVVPELQQRFKMIVVSRLKEVRKWVETRQKLMASLESGGMGFSYEQAEKFLKLVDEKKEGLLKNEIASVASLPRNDKKPVLPTLAPVAPLAPKRDSSGRSVGFQNDKGGIASSPVAPRNAKKTSSDIKNVPPQP
ncbi:MAG: hypothetical protein AAB666_03670, partial [Patescibacteria group bacterium]